MKREAIEDLPERDLCRDVVEVASNDDVWLVLMAMAVEGALLTGHSLCPSPNGSA
jgi:hypothetical protein